MAIAACANEGGALACREDGACTYVTEEESCGSSSGAVLGSLPVLQLDVQDSVPFKATALDIGSRLGLVCTAAR